MIIPRVGTVDANSFYTQISIPQKNSVSKTVRLEIKKDNKQNSAKYPPSVFDNLIKKVTNKRDLNDTVIVPRSIFKGYFSFMTSTSIATLAGFIKNTKPISKTIKTMMNTISVAIAAFGTYYFVNPYLVRQNEKK